MTADDDGYRSRHCSAGDGLRLFYREYGDPASSATPLVCLPGLTRNAADFHDLAARYAPGRRVIALDYRGRGRSAYDPDPRNYRAEVYVSDALHLLAAANVPRAVVVGVSLGGLLAMFLAAHRPGVLAGVVLNDIGPEIESAGLEWIRRCLARDMRPGTWDEAAALAREVALDAAPDLAADRWMTVARRSFREDEAGVIRPDFDPAVAVAFAKEDPPPDLWPLYGGLGRAPTLAIRGALSDVLSAATFERMAEAKPDLVRVEVPNRGHVPWLDEPECLAALDEFVSGL